MTCRLRKHPFPVLTGILVCLAVGLGIRSGSRPAAAQPAKALPAALQYVPADAAVFVHADADKLWSGPIGKAVRGADEKLFADLTAKGKDLFGITPDQIESVTAFWPKFKGPGDDEAFGVVIAFKNAYDRKKIESGLDKLFKGGTRPKLIAPSDRLAVLLFELDDSYGKPRPAGKPGPLTATLREAATGKHLLSYGVTLSNIPDQLRGDDLPEEARPFKPLFQAETLSSFLTFDKDLRFEVRVKAASGPKAIEAEKALGFVSSMLQQQLGGALKGLDGPMNTVAVARELLKSLKATKFATTGDETRATLTLPADLPYGKAFAEAVGKVREAAARAQSQNNLKQIAIALHNYHDVHGSLPPAAVVDKKGKPVLSWRVLILPYIEQNDLYQKFKLDEPWDSPNNIKLIDQMPKVYALPTPTKAKANETHYRVFVGNGSAWDYLKGSKLQEFIDGTSNTIVVVTAADAVPWTKPDELEFDPEKDMKKLLGFFESSVCNVALGDGSVRSLSKSIAAKTLNALITRGGGEVIGDDF
jgi:hypothetical protein